jgi:hypothetical protein
MKSKQTIAMTREGRCEIEVGCDIRAVDASWWIKVTRKQRLSPEFLVADQGNAINGVSSLLPSGRTQPDEASPGARCRADRTAVASSLSNAKVSSHPMQASVILCP